MTLPLSRLAAASRGCRLPLPCRGWHVPRRRQPSPVPLRIQQRCHLPYVMSYGHCGELGPCQTAAPVVEASEAAVIFDLHEDRLGLDRTHAPVVIVILYHKSNSYSFDDQKNSYFSSFAEDAGGCPRREPCHPRHRKRGDHERSEWWGRAIARRSPSGSSRRSKAI